MTMANKSIVRRALAGLIETGDVDALGGFLSDGFVHHRPGPASASKVEWPAAVRTALVPLAGMRVEIFRMVADGEHVVVHSRRWLPDSGAEIVVVDIFRVEDGLIAEGWEIIEPVGRAAANLVWWETARPPGPT